jgi:RNase P/RNase MRP subunit p30
MKTISRVESLTHNRVNDAINADSVHRLNLLTSLSNLLSIRNTKRVQFITDLEKLIQKYNGN